MNLLIYDIKDIGDKLKNYLGKFKDLVLVYEEDENSLKRYWGETKNILDATRSHKFYKKVKESTEQDEKIFKKDVNFVLLRNRKVVKLESLATFLYNKDNFSDEDYAEIVKKKELFQEVLNDICSSFKNNLEKNLEEILKKTPLDVSLINPEKGKLFLVKEIKDKTLTEENVIDLNDFELLKELKDILIYQV